MRQSWKVGLLCALAVLSVPAGSAVQQQPVVTGHTVYSAMDGLDPCMAGVVGIVRMRVMWFNDQVLFERAAGDGSGYIYSIEANAPDPRDQKLLATGNVYSFSDPNGIEWNITEYNFTAGADALVHGGDAGYVNGSVVARPPTVDPSPQLRTYYTWVVRTGPTTEDTAATNRPYNFVDLVDTCKFIKSGPERGVHHTHGANNTWTSDWGNDTTQQAHQTSDPSHNHEVFDINLYVGGEPHVITTVDPDFLGEVN